MAVRRKLLKILGDLGLTENEVRVYLALISINTGRTVEIAQASAVKRTTVYSVLNQLIQRGLVRNYNQAGKEFFKPVNPYELLDRQLKLYNELEEILPDLVRLAQHQPQQPVLLVYANPTELEQVWEELGSLTSDVSSIIDLENSALLKNEDANLRFIRNRLLHRLFQRCIVTDSQKVSEFANSDSRALRKTASLPLIIPFELHILPEKVLFIAKDGYSGFAVEGTPFRTVLLSLFDQLWQTPQQQLPKRQPKSKMPTLVGSADHLTEQLEKTDLSFCQKQDFIDSIIAEIKAMRRDPRSIPIPRNLAYQVSVGLDSIPLTDKLDTSPLVDLLHEGFNGISYLKNVAAHDLQFRKNIEHADNGIYLRASLIPSLRRINKFLAHYDLSLYLLGGHRSRDCQEEIWQTVYDTARETYLEISDRTDVNLLAREYANRYVIRPPERLRINDPRTWFPFATGGSLLVTLGTKAGYPLELGIQNLDLSPRSHPFYFEEYRPRHSSEIAMQQNRRMLFWSMWLGGWSASPTLIMSYSACGTYRTQVGIRQAKIFSRELSADHLKANIGAVERKSRH